MTARKWEIIRRPPPGTVAESPNPPAVAVSGHGTTNHPDRERKTQEGAFSLEFEIPLRTVTGLNAREIWQVRSARVKSERAKTARAMTKALGVPRWKCSSVVRLPALVTLTRIGPREPDDDAIQPALKAVRDAIASYLGVDDGCDYLRFRYMPHERGEFGVRVRIEALDADLSGSATCPQGDRGSQP